jgi:hypothetical protein
MIELLEVHPVEELQEQKPFKNNDPPHSDKREDEEWNGLTGSEEAKNLVQHERLRSPRGKRRIRVTRDF